MRGRLTVVLISVSLILKVFFFYPGTFWSSIWEYCPFSNWIFIAIKLFDSLHILGINPHQMHNWLAFSLHLQDGLFMLLTASFVVQKPFSSTQSHLSIFYFIFYAFGVIIKETLPELIS